MRSRQPFPAGFVYGNANHTRMSEMTNTIEHEGNEQAKVESWRLHVLIEAGYPLPVAERLAGSNADLHGAVELISRGCAPETAAEILL